MISAKQDFFDNQGNLDPHKYISHCKEHIDQHHVGDHINYKRDQLLQLNVVLFDGRMAEPFFYSNDHYFLILPKDPAIIE